MLLISLCVFDMENSLLVSVTGLLIALMGNLGERLHNRVANMAASKGLVRDSVIYLFIYPFDTNVYRIHPSFLILSFYNSN
jgi:hypothetical protein